ncbi:MAG: ATP-binding protein [Gemmatimonadota bacterium]|nr:ATP-binding protein [Gemmatimonadota bacterium]
MEALCAEIEHGAGAVVLLEEALATETAVLALARALESQPEWSDLPVHVFVADPECPIPGLARLLDLSTGRSLIVLERPVRPATLVSLMGAALRNRDRQYRLQAFIEDLRTARKTAEKASAAKSEFLAVMSHELRTPLNAVIGYGDLLVSETAGPVNAAQRQFVERIKASAWHLLGLIEDILTFSRAEAGKETVHRVRLDAGALARDAVSLLEPRAAAKGLALRVTVPDAPIEIDTDAKMLRQILLNLLSNAVKFTDEGEVELRLELAEAGRFVASVRDTGIGIAPEDQARAFEPFEQVDASMTRRQQGTGLGLGVSRQLARLLGGELTCESELGLGSTFTLTLRPSTGTPPQ